MKPVLKNRAGIPPADILEKILSTESSPTNQALPLENEAPYITWLADPDARIQPSLVLTNPAQKIFTVRSLGNQLTTSLAAIDYGVVYLHTPILLITGNTDNQSIRFFTEGYSGLSQTIRQDLDHLHLPLSSSNKEKIQDDTLLHIQLSEDNVDYQVALALERYRERVEKSRLVVVGSILDTVNHYGKGKNRLYIININGEKDRAKLKKLNMLRSIEPSLLANVGRPEME